MCDQVEISLVSKKVSTEVCSLGTFTKKQSSESDQLRYALMIKSLFGLVKCRSKGLLLKFLDYVDDFHTPD